jgi:O-succinylbenzoate synthase
VRIPLVHPHVYAGGEEHTREVVLVRMTDEDDRDGWGECSTMSAPGYAGGTTDDAWQSLCRELAPAWLRGRTLPEASAMALAALDEAVRDLALRDRGVSLADDLAVDLGPRRDSVEWCAVVGMADTDEIAARVDAALAAGARLIKLKVVPGRDVEPLRRVRDRHPDIALAADANGSYPAVDAVPFELAELGLAYVEQPLAADDLRGTAELAAALGVPVALDESLTSVDRLDEAASFGAPFTLSVKAARLGGIAEAARVLGRARDHGFPAFVGGMLETAVGRAIALGVAAQAPCTLPCDAGPTPRYFTDDIGPRFVPDADGNLRVPTAAGIGITPDAAALDRFCTDRVTVAA